MRFILLLLSIVLLAGLAGCRKPFGPEGIPEATEVVPEEIKLPKTEQTSRLQELQRVSSPIYRLGPQDRVSVVVYEHPELEIKDIVITPDGYISTPLVGPVKIGGLTLEAATSLLKERYSKYIKNPLVSLIPIQVLGHNFTIAGKVNSPGRYPISGTTTRLMDAVALAKGFSQGEVNGDTTEIADLENAYIVRNGELLPVDFRKAIYEGNPLHNIPLVNGDYIFVPSEMNTGIYILGEVKIPTYIGYKEGITFLKAITYVRGFLDTRARYANLIRGGLKKPKLYRIDIDRVIKGEIQDIKLAPNDIIYVPKSNLSDWNVIVSEVVPTLQALNLLAGPFGNASALYAQ